MKCNNKTHFLGVTTWANHIWMQNQCWKALYSQNHVEKNTFIWNFTIYSRSRIAFCLIWKVFFFFYTSHFYFIPFKYIVNSLPQGRKAVCQEVRKRVSSGLLVYQYVNSLRRFCLKPIRQTKDEFFCPGWKTDGAEILRGKYQKDLEKGILCLGACWSQAVVKSQEGLGGVAGLYKGRLDSFLDIFML